MFATARILKQAAHSFILSLSTKFFEKYSRNVGDVFQEKQETAEEIYGNLPHLCLTGELSECIGTALIIKRVYHFLYLLSPTFIKVP